MDENILDGMSRIFAVNIVGLSRYQRIKKVIKLKSVKCDKVLKTDVLIDCNEALKLCEMINTPIIKNMYLAGRTPLTFQKKYLY
jgi:hypothetical protein